MSERQRRNDAPSKHLREEAPARTSVESSAGEGRIELRDTLALGLLATASLLFVVVLNLTPVFSSDFWIQLKVGDLIRETGEIPDTVLFSFTEAGDRPFTAYEWLPSLMSSHAFAMVGYEGMIVIKCAMLLVLFALTVLLCHRVSRDPGLSLALGCLCVLGVNYRSLLRPELLALILGLASLNLLYEFTRSRRPAWLLGLLPVGLVWANAHGSFLLNLALPGMFAAGLVADEAFDAFRSRRRPDWTTLSRGCGWLALATLALALVSLANPFGVSLLTHVFALSESEFIRENIMEWRAPFDPSLRHHPFLRVYLVFSFVLLASCVSGWRRLKPSLLVLIVPFWLMSIDAMRHITWFTLVGTFVLAHTLATPGESRRSRRIFAVVSAFVLVAGSLWAAVAGNVRGRTPGFRMDTPLSQAAIAFLAERDVSGNVFNAYEYGDQLVYHFYPRVRVAMDSRLDAYGAEHFRAYRQLTGRNLELLAEPAKLIAFLDRYGVDVIVTRPHDYRHWAGAGHAEALAKARFERVYADRNTIILERRQGSE